MMPRRPRLSEPCAAGFIHHHLCLLLLVVGLPVFDDAWTTAIPFATALQIRTSRLTAWKTHKQQDDDKAVIGWAREERDEEQQSYQVQLGLGDDGVSASTATSTTTTVMLPFMTNQDPLGATLWSSGLALSILVLSSSSIKLSFRDQGEEDEEEEEGEEEEAFTHLNIDDKSILEIGAGLGLPGRTLAAQQQQGGTPRKVVLTDNDEAVIAASQTLDVFTTSAAAEANKPATLESRQLEWRDCPPNTEGKALDQEVFDIILGADVAYYFFLLRPLMDAVQHYMAYSDATCLIVGQANRESQWDLYHNIKQGCYNPRTDLHDAPWPGQTSVLLYNLYSTEWVEESSAAPATMTSVPIAAILHQNAMHNDGKRIRLTPCDYVATKQDEDAIDKSF
mmetsp:Transcript_12926/g.35780  ORF Transcript_12926/g.35780 Transcript_12926/m.35780 type:complete len:393 (-) Transcript_12926:23-1201(-)